MKTEVTDFQQLSLYIGLDVHKKQWSVSIYTPTAHHRTFSQPPTPVALKNYLDHHFAGAEIVCAYEACKFGYWIQRELTSFGYRCLVVNPADIPTSNKESSEKADPSDSRKIGKALRAGLLNSIYIPSRAQKGTDNFSATARNSGRIWYGLRTGSRISFSFQVFPFRRSTITTIGQRSSCCGLNKPNCPMSKPGLRLTFCWSSIISSIDIF